MWTSVWFTHNSNNSYLKNSLITKLSYKVLLQFRCLIQQNGEKGEFICQWYFVGQSWNVSIIIITIRKAHLAVVSVSSKSRISVPMVHGQVYWLFGIENRSKTGRILKCTRNERWQMWLWDYTKNNLMTVCVSHAECVRLDRSSYSHCLNLHTEKKCLKQFAENW